LLTGSIRPSHEQSCSRRSKAGPGADVAIAAALAGKPGSQAGSRTLSVRLSTSAGAIALRWLRLKSAQ
jgi:hypothetical protein